MSTKVLITDDHGVVRQGLRMYLSRDPDLEVVGEAENGEEALRLARDLAPDRSPHGPPHAGDGRHRRH